MLTKALLLFFIRLVSFAPSSACGQLTLFRETSRLIPSNPRGERSRAAHRTRFLFAEDSRHPAFAPGTPPAGKDPRPSISGRTPKFFGIALFNEEVAAQGSPPDHFLTRSQVDLRFTAGFNIGPWLAPYVDHVRNLRASKG